MNQLQKSALMMRVDDTLSVFSTHGIAGLTGGLLVGISATLRCFSTLGLTRRLRAST